MDAAQDQPSVPDTIGTYKILGILGEGGMGTVYLAEQREPVQRRVALKVVKLGMDSKEVLARFEAERQALALMNHPNIARVLDSGRTDDGRPYFAMDVVPGLPITEYCDKQRLPISERLQLFAKVCRAAQHAHQKGVIHRDIKPSNLLVQVQDGQPIPKIIDFGVAKALDRRLAERTLYTERGQIIGTPEYMSPEQAEMSGLDVDARTDIYSLGVLLYEILSGSLPFDGKELRQAGYLEIQRRIREDDPPRPSTRLTTLDANTKTEIAQQRRSEVGSLQRRLRGDLDWIVMRALEKDPTRRYQTASELAADIERHLRHDPVDAGPPGFGYRFGKFIRRHKGQVLAGALILAALLFGLVGTVSGWAEARKEAATARRKETEANENLHRYQLLSARVKLDAARESAAHLDRTAASIPAMQSWLAEYGPLGGRLGELRQTLESLQANALDPTAEAEFRFASEDDQFLHDTLAPLVRDLDAFQSSSGLIALIRGDLEWAEQTHERLSRSDAEIWRTTLDSIRGSQPYKDLWNLRPQFGLKPLGPDPVSGLHEFWVIGSGDEPTRDSEGALLAKPGNGLVLVLLPAGRFWMGAQKDEPAQPNYDPVATPAEGPPHEITLGAFFLAKFEMSQGQWLALGGPERSKWRPNGPERAPTTRELNLDEPVENVSWDMCHGLLSRWGLALPTEAQWEYGCRAGTTTPWWTGSDADSLTGAANLPDLAAKRAGQPWGENLDLPDLDDGYVIHAPVHTMRANPFGLHHMHGNVWEWCLDAFAAYDAAEPSGPGGLRAAEGRERVLRGGDFYSMVALSRSSSRNSLPPNQSVFVMGVRPARAIDR